MFKKWVLLGLLMPMSSYADIYASSVTNIYRGSVAGNFSGYYGGTYPGSFPVALTEAQAVSAVLGAPDSNFVSLPGAASAGSGTAFQGAYVEVSFGTNFDANTILNIWELGDNQESAQLFLWTTTGGNIQQQITRGANDLYSLDLSIFASTLAGTFGGASFTKVGIGGLDIFGASAGFDLDAVSISSPAAVPVPAAAWLFGSGLLGFAGLRKRRNA
jgi:hypothetical protein